MGPLRNPLFWQRLSFVVFNSDHKSFKQNPIAHMETIDCIYKLGTTDFLQRIAHKITLGSVHIFNTGVLCYQAQ